MRVIGKYVRTHARHFRQQADYTICAAFDERRYGLRFHRHQSVFSKRDRQDYLWKYDLPSTARIPILKRLDENNLNAFSLFDSQETLLETVWLCEQIFRERLSPKYLMSELPLPLTSETLADILREHGYETHPKGMVRPLGVRSKALDRMPETPKRNAPWPD